MSSCFQFSETCVTVHKYRKAVTSICFLIEKSLTVNCMPLVSPPLPPSYYRPIYLCTCKQQQQVYSVLPFLYMVYTYWTRYIILRLKYLIYFIISLLGGARLSYTCIAFANNSTILATHSGIPDFQLTVWYVVILRGDQ